MLAGRAAMAASSWAALRTSRWIWGAMGVAGAEKRWVGRQGLSLRVTGWAS